MMAFPAVQAFFVAYKSFMFTVQKEFKELKQKAQRDLRYSDMLFSLLVIIYTYYAVLYTNRCMYTRLYSMYIFIYVV